MLDCCILWFRLWNVSYLGSMDCMSFRKSAERAWDRDKQGVNTLERVLFESTGTVSAAQWELTWGFMFGPGIPIAAICSMFGAPRPPNGVPPIWNTSQRQLRCAAQQQHSTVDLLLISCFLKRITVAVFCFVLFFVGKVICIKDFLTKANMLYWILLPIIAPKSCPYYLSPFTTIQCLLSVAGTLILLCWLVFQTFKISVTKLTIQ